ncbi:MAG: GYD domain-containing protein [Anaerolineales bacterium]|nr:GYD domain-containing protein [Anaerolineales bacterium]
MDKEGKKATYIILINLTKQGVKDIKNATARIETAAKSLEAAGGKMLHFYATMGPHDYTAIAEGSGDEVAMLQLIGLGMAGNVKTTTLRAFIEDEFKAILDLYEAFQRAPLE